MQSRQTRRSGHAGRGIPAAAAAIPAAIAASLAVVAVFTIGVTAVVTNAYPSTSQLSAAAVPLVTVTGTFVAGWMGDLINFGAVVSAFGASLACAVGAG